MKYFLSLLLSTISVSAYSRNQTISEWGISLTYNTHLVDWEIDVPDSGTPVFNGYFYILGTNAITNEGYNETLGEEPIRVHPKWTKENSLRVCMSFFSTQSGITEREYIRWSLEYKPPQYFPGFWPQMVSLVNGTEKYAENITSFCQESREFIEEPEIPEVEDARRLLLTDEEALAEEKRLEQYEKGLTAEAADLPPAFNGYETTNQYVDIELLEANISFTRPFALQSDYNM